MHTPDFFRALAALCLCVPAFADSPMEYPDSRTEPQFDTYHRTVVPDPYRWLEDLDSDETAAWVTAQNALTFSYLDAIPVRDVLKERLTALWDYPRFGMPFEKAGRYFYYKNDGLQNQSVLYWMEGLDDATAKPLIDPNTFSEDGTSALSTLSVSDDGKRIVYGVSGKGSDWKTFRVRDIDTGTDLPDVLEWVKFSGASWAPDGSGFYYSRFDAPEDGDAYEAKNEFQKLYFHKLGDKQADDTLVFEDKTDPQAGFGGWVTDDGRYLMIGVFYGTDPNNRIFYIDLNPTEPEDENSQPKVVKLLNENDAEYDMVGNHGPLFYFLTDLDAPNRRLVEIDIRKPARRHWRTLVQEGKSVIRGVSYVDGQFIVHRLVDAASRVAFYTRDGKAIKDLELPGIGSVGGLRGDPDGKEMFYSFSSFIFPSTIYRYDFTTGKSTVFREPGVDFDPAPYTVNQVFYESRDGTKVPMFLVHKKDLALDGNNPVFLTAYGGFGISRTPYFRLSAIPWLERGGIFALPNLRGGGEYGREWHEAGRVLKKQNVFDDFIAAAEYLIAEKYTRPERLAIQGGSNGGLLMGACMTQRPDLFGAVVCAVGVLDMLRFQKFTIGWAWVSEYGSSEDPEQFETLLGYSPLHNLYPGAHYPATLITTGDHDDRVVPAHSFKYAAALQRAQGGPAPTLIRIETSAGHGAGKPTSKIIKAIADEWAFVMRALGME